MSEVVQDHAFLRLPLQPRLVLRDNFSVAGEGVQMDTPVPVHTWTLQVMSRKRLYSDDLGQITVAICLVPAWHLMINFRAFAVAHTFLLKLSTIAGYHGMPTCIFQTDRIQTDFTDMKCRISADCRSSRQIHTTQPNRCALQLRHGITTSKNTQCFISKHER